MNNEYIDVDEMSYEQQEIEAKKLLGNISARQIIEVSNAVEEAEGSTLSTEDNDKVNIIVSKKYTHDVKNNFVMLFYENLFDIIKKHKLGMIELEVLLTLLKFASYGNLLSYTQKAIGKIIDKPQPNVSRALKKLRDKNILIKLETGEYLNPHIITKGNIGKMASNEIFEELTKKSQYASYEKKEVKAKKS